MRQVLVQEGEKEVNDIELKPHKGMISDWFKLPCGLGLGYLIMGHLRDHEDYRGGVGNTSYVVKHDEATGEIETRNSRYTLVGGEIA